MKKKKVLLFIDWFLPGYRAGGPIQSCANLIEHLAGEFDFSVVTRDTDYMSETRYFGIISDEWNILPNGTRVFYFSDNNLSKKRIDQLLDKEQYDIVYLNGIFSFYFTLAPLLYLNRKKNKKIIIASRGMLAASALSVKRVKKFIFLKIASVFQLFKEVQFHATNLQEEQDIKTAFGSKSKVAIAPNLSQFKNNKEWKERTKEEGVVRLVSIARISPEKNTMYALEVLSRLKCNAYFDLYGPIYNKEYWNDCLRIINQLPENVKVNYKGAIESEKVAETLSSYHFLFLPTSGENFGHVILQSLNAGLPVIISDTTMWKDLSKMNCGWDIPLASQNEFISVIEECARMGQMDYSLLSKGAFDFAWRYINNQESIEQNRQLFLKW